MSHFIPQRLVQSHLFFSRTQRLLLDYRPLKRHQQQYNVEVPWKEVKVVIQTGRFTGSLAVVKNVRLDFRGALRLSLWVIAQRCSIDIDHSAVRESV